jgi:RNA polymerase sigma factor (sigma-70 family)
MAGSRLNNLLRYLRRTAAPPDGPAIHDGQLLERFAAARDEDAFETVARRHGPMVLGVCRRVLGDAHEAEDAFQATFLVLARKAASVARYSSVGGWLYTVAYRVALRARSRRDARSTREQPLDEPPTSAALDPVREAGWREVRRVIDEEVSRLPETYRAPFVLYHLEGRSSVEVARELGCPVGTVESWLTRARARLRTRLARRGLAPTPGLFALLAPQTGWLPRAVATARAVLATGRGAAGGVSAEAAALADEVVQALSLARIKVVVAVLLLLVVTAAGSAGLAARMHPRAETPARPEGQEAVRRDEAQPADRARAPELVKLRAFPANTEFKAFALSPDGETLAVTSHEAQIKLWKVREQEVFALDQSIPAETSWVYALAFSPDGKTLASGNMAKAVKLWDVATRQEKATLQGHTVSVYSVAFSPDGRTLASAGGVQPGASKTFKTFAEVRKAFETTPESEWLEVGEVKVWDLATKRDRTFFRRSTGRITSLAFSPDGKTLASGGRDGAVRLWDVATGKECACLQEIAYPVDDVAFSPDGKTLAAVQNGQDAGVKLWDVASGRVRARLKGRSGRATSVAFSPDGRTLATASDGAFAKPKQGRGEVRLWDTATGKPVGIPLTFDHMTLSLAFGARGKILAVGGPNPVRGSGKGEVTLLKLGPRNGKGQ